MQWYTYILTCKNGSYYVGHTYSLKQRFEKHSRGSGAQHTAIHHADEIVYSEKFATEEEAIRREKQLKGWSRAKKKALIENDSQRLKQLSKSSKQKK